jgi:hypothetical protein
VDGRVDGVDLEVLDVGPRGLRRPSRRVVIGAVVVLVLLAIAAYADSRSRAHESRALDTCRSELHAAAVTSDQQMLAVATTTHGPLASTPGTSLGLAGLMARSAHQLLPDAVHADEVCRHVSVRPWHFSLKARRDATTAYAGALATKLRAVAADGRTPYLEDPRLRSLRRAADLSEFGGAS